MSRESLRARLDDITARREDSADWCLTVKVPELRLALDVIDAAQKLRPFLVVDAFSSYEVQDAVGHLRDALDAFEASP